MRSVAEAEKYFKDLGKVLTNQPDRNQRAKFMQTMRRTDPDYQEAVGALRLRTRLKRAGVDTEKFQIQPIGELAIQLANAPVKTRFIGMTPYGAPITKFYTKFLTHIIIPIRIDSPGMDRFVGTLVSLQIPSEGVVRNYFPFVGSTKVAKTSAEPK